MTVWLCQCLCPDRHCIMATAGEAYTEADAVSLVRAPLRRKVGELLGGALLNPWCALCGANRATWRYELRRTKFATMENAMPELLVAEGANLVANLTWGDIHKTSKPN